MNDHEIMGTGKILPLIAKFGIPGAIIQIVQVSYSIIGSLFVGNGVGSQGLAALSACLPAALFFIALCILFAAGAATLFGIRLGERDLEGAKRVMATTVFINVVAGVVVLVLVLLFAKPMLALSGCPPELIGYASTYLYIYGGGFITQVLGYTFNGFITSCGHPNRALLTHAVAVTLSVILNYWFVLHMGLGVAGSAWATVVSWAFAALVAMQFFVSPAAPFRLGLKDIRPERAAVPTIVKYGLPVFLMQMGNVIYISIFIHVVTHYGAFSPLGQEGALAVANVVSRGYQVLLVIPLGLCFGCQAIFSYNLGAKLYDRLKRLYWSIFAVSLLVLLVLWVPVLTHTEFIMRLFGLDTAAIQTGTYLMRIDVALAPLTALEIVTGAYLQGTGHYREGSLLMVCRSVVVISIFTLLFPAVLPHLTHLDALESIYVASPSSDVVLLVMSIILLRKVFRELEKLRSASHESPASTAAR